jgi:prepilin-type N-terminal cleavage/methylation domain-containing protein
VTTRSARAGFTLIEVLAVMFLTALVLGVALNVYVDLSNDSRRASEATRGVRRAASLLDRLARDFESTVLVRKPEETDPLVHPWIFVADSRHSETGADRVKFVMRRPADARAGDGVSDLAMVCYELRPGPHGDDFELVRWSQPGLPEALDREFPPADDPNALLLADGIAGFALRFLGEDGEWVTEWDSSQLLDSSALPLAVEIELQLATWDPATEQMQVSPTYLRRALLPVRPLDLATLLDPVAYAGAGGDAEGDGKCELTVADCVDLSMVGNMGGSGGELGPDQMAAVQAQIQAAGGLANMCWEDFRAQFANHPAVRPNCR